MILLRFIKPERLMSVESLPDITDFFATMQSPITPLLPSFWAGEVLFASLQGGHDFLHAAALSTTALGLTLLAAAANERWYFAGFSKAQEGRKARFTWLIAIERIASRIDCVHRDRDSGPPGVLSPSDAGRKTVPSRARRVAPKMISGVMRRDQSSDAVNRHQRRIGGAEKL